MTEKEELEEVKRHIDNSRRGLTYSNDYIPNLNTEIMSRITVKKEDLIKVLGENRDLHAKEYEEAYAGYKQLCIEALEERLKEIQDGEEIKMYFNDLQDEPQNHVEDYQNVIDMLEVGENDTVLLDQGEYMKYYKNDWQWKRHWSLSNKAYVDKFHSM